MIPNMITLEFRKPNNEWFNSS